MDGFMRLRKYDFLIPVVIIIIGSVLIAYGLGYQAGYINGYGISCKRYKIANRIVDNYAVGAMIYFCGDTRPFMILDKSYTCVPVDFHKKPSIVTNNVEFL